MDHNPPKAAGRPAAAGADLSSDHDGAAYAGAVGQAEKILRPHSGAEFPFPKGCGVYVVLHRHRHVKPVLQEFPHLRSRVAGNVVVGVVNRPSFRVHLAGGADADGVKGGILLQDFCRPLHEPRSALPGVGVTLHKLREGFPVPDAGFDGRSADV